MNKWLLFITSLLTENATIRMRVRQALKVSGAVVLRVAIADDDKLLASVSGVFDGLLTAFDKGVPTHEPT
jgi:hypothetical protein